MATLKRQKARKEYDCTKCKGKIKKGDEYYRFALTRFNPLCPLCLTCKPTRSQMTGSDFLATMYGIEDDSIAGLNIGDMEDAQSSVEAIVGELEELRDETESRHENMPEQLQDAPTGELLQGRVDSVQEMIDELEAVDVDIDDELSEEEKEERKEEILGELTGIGYGGE